MILNKAQDCWVEWIDAGLVPFHEMWEKQHLWHKEIVEAKRSELDTSRFNKLICCEHPHVYTLGKSGKIDHLLLSDAELEEKDASFYKINRGGDITYHGPGQLVVYPIFDLELFGRDVHLYIRNIEEAIIALLNEYNIIGTRIKGYTGVWVQTPNGYEKICAIGVHLSRWVSMHGLALNVNSMLEMFNHIVPCGINDEDKRVCSMQSLSGYEMDLERIKVDIKKHFKNTFRYHYLNSN